MSTCTLKVMGKSVGFFNGLANLATAIKSLLLSYNPTVVMNGPAPAPVIEGVYANLLVEPVKGDFVQRL